MTVLSRHQGQAQAGQLQASPRPPTAQCDLVESQKAQGRQTSQSTSEGLGAGLVAPEQKALARPSG